MTKVQTNQALQVLLTYGESLETLFTSQMYHSIL